MRWCFCFLFLLLTTTLLAQNTKEITLEDIWKKGTFKQESVAGFRSMKDGLHYSEIDTNGDLRKVKFSDGQADGIITNLRSITFNKDTLKVEDYEFNADESKLLLLTKGEAIYRRSVLHLVYIYDIASGEVIQLNEAKVLHASFSPNSKQVAYVKENNLMIFDLKSGETIAVTTDGNYNILNGNCDWVYEEEFEFTKAYEWSTDGSFISYYRFDQTLVPEYHFAIYDKLYPTDYRYKYPKAGEKNSIVDIYSYYVQSGDRVKYKLGSETDIYIPRIKMNPFNNSLIIYRMNRWQNKLELLEGDEEGNCSVVFTEENKYYVEVNDDIYFLHQQNAFIYSSERSGYRHIYRHDIATNESKALTTGDWEVTAIQGVDETKKLVYFMSAEASPMERNLFSVDFEGKGKICLTPDKGWHDIYFSEGYEYFMKKYSLINTPPVYSICNKTGATIRVLKDNQALKDKMKEYGISPLELIQVPNANGVKLNAWFIKPLAFDDKKEYPLLMYQYSGPGSQEVKNQFSGRDFWWYQMLAQKGYLIVCVDGTGTGFRGEEFKKKTYMKLGKYESDDQIAVANYFMKQTYVDAKRIGIWGWSYGGFMSSTCIMKAPTVFKTAIAVAPVTNWRYYDNIYTERYMRTPQENPTGYDENSPINMVKGLKGNFLLIHGSADDNVHLQNSMMMIDEMVKQNKDFDSEIYPNKNHGISGGNTRLQLYRKMTNFILEKL